MDLAGIGDKILQFLQNKGNSAGEPAKNETFIDFISSPKFYLSVIVVLVAVAAWILLKKVSKHYNKRIIESDVDSKARSQRRTIAHIMTSIFRVLIILGAIIGLLQIQGYNVSTLLTSVGILTAIIGFALQDAIKDVIGGLYILADHYFEVGDVISYNGSDGEVIRMSIRSTTIKDIDNGNIVTISNRSFSEAHRVANWWDIDLGLSYNEQVSKVHSVLADACKEISKIKGIENCVYKGTNEFGTSSVIYKIRCFSNPTNKYELRRSALKVLQSKLEKENISIPYNYLNVVLAKENRNNSDK